MQSNMFCTKLFLLLHILHLGYCDWESDWVSPIRKQLTTQQKPAKAGDDQAQQYRPNVDHHLGLAEDEDEQQKETRIGSFKTKLQTIMESAKSLANVLKEQIQLVTAREIVLKETITNGRLGVTTVKVSTTNSLPKTYIIRDGLWTLCDGLVQPPVRSAPGPHNLFQELFSTPKCIGQEVSSRRDPCVFNSIIKYETLPENRSLEYVEEDVLCLKSTFNSTLEQYLSVPRRIVEDTCQTGEIRTPRDNIQGCGIRAVSEYTYYPHKTFASAGLPLEYCTEVDGTCKLIVAWHLSNSTIENFEFLKDDQRFLEFFIKPIASIDRVL